MSLVSTVNETIYGLLIQHKIEHHYRVQLEDVCQLSAVDRLVVQDERFPAANLTNVPTGIQSCHSQTAAPSV